MVAENIRLPSEMSGNGLRKALIGIPIRNRHRQSGHFTCEFAPKKSLEGLLIDDSQVRTISAEAVCALAAYMEWIRDHAPAGLQIRCSPGSTLRECGLSSDLTVVEDNKSKQPLGVHRLDLGASPKTLPLSADARSRISQAVVTIMRRCSSSQFPLGLQETDAVRIFLQEGLTNVVEHAYVSTNVNAVAWVGLGITSVEESVSLFADNPHDPTGDWCERHKRNGARFVIELCICDTGVGIVESLGESYFAEHAFGISTELKNGSLTTAAGGFWVDFYASTNTIISTGDYFIGTEFVSGIGSNNLAIVSWSGPFPNGIPDNTYWVGWIIDATDAVNESDESNNIEYKRGYQLIVTSSDPYEPNDVMSSAYYLGGPVATYVVDSYINPSGDEDWYRVTEDAGFTLTITLDLLPADYDLELYDAAGTLLVGSYSTGTFLESIVYPAPSTGSYYIRVYGFASASSSTSQYQLTVNVP